MFTVVYIRVLGGNDYAGWSTATAYSLWNVTELLWAVFMLRDIRRSELRQA